MLIVSPMPGDFVQWDYVRRQCMPKVDFLAAGSRVLPFHDIASKSELVAFQESVIADARLVEDRMTNTIANAVTRASEIVAANQETVTAVVDMLSTWQDELSEQLESIEETLQDTLVEQLDGTIASAESAIEGIQELIDTVAADAVATFEAFEHTPFIDHSLPVYRWGTWSSYAQCCGWFNGNNPTLVRRMTSALPVRVGAGVATNPHRARVTLRRSHQTRSSPVWRHPPLAVGRRLGPGTCAPAQRQQELPPDAFQQARVLWLAVHGDGAAVALVQFHELSVRLVGC